jgi:hypothetical protein
MPEALGDASCLSGLILQIFAHYLNLCFNSRVGVPNSTSYRVYPDKVNEARAGGALASLSNTPDTCFHAGVLGPGSQKLLIFSGEARALYFCVKFYNRKMLATN